MNSQQRDHRDRAHTPTAAEAAARPIANDFPIAAQDGDGVAPGAAMHGCNYCWPQLNEPHILCNARSDSYG